ncbi:MAG: flagellar export chaperone FliS [Acidimicrobiia bacterium]
MTQRSLRQVYLAETVATIPSTQLVTMLYDRLCRDLTEAEAAIERSDIEATNSNLQNAQRIVSELNNALDVDAWEPAKGLRAVYSYVETQLVTANMTKSAALVAECRSLIEPLRDTWHEAVSKS